MICCVFLFLKRRNKMDETMQGIIELMKINSLSKLRRVPNDRQDIRCGNLLLVMAVNCLLGLPMGADLQVAGYNLDTAKEQVDCSVLINKQQFPPDGLLRPQPMLRKDHE